MARNNFAQIRYRVFVILECLHEISELWLAPAVEGRRIFCEECEDVTRIALAQSDPIQ